LLTRAHVVVSVAVAVKIASIRSVNNRGCTIDRNEKKEEVEDGIKLFVSLEAQSCRCHPWALDVEVCPTGPPISTADGGAWATKDSVASQKLKTSNLTLR